MLKTNVKNDSDKLKLGEGTKPLRDKEVADSKLNVVGECSHQFSPQVLKWSICYLKVIFLFIRLE
jgi:hypothetical protein